jgi:hypothetical protein
MDAMRNLNGNSDPRQVRRASCGSIGEGAGMSEALDGEVGEGVRKKKVGASTEIRVAPPKPFDSLSEREDASDEKIE